MSNTFTGTFTTPAKEAEFLAITDTVKVGQFADEIHLTMVSLPNATSIGYGAFQRSKLTTLSLLEATTIEQYAFKNSPLTSISILKATTIGYDAFTAIVNATTTKVTMPDKFNTKADKDSIFQNGWDKITFKWLKSFISYNGKLITKPFIPHTTGPHAGKKVVKITMGSKTLTFI